MWKFSVLALVFLAACATPYEQCVNSATKNLRVVNQLIASKQQVLARGYDIQRETFTRTRFERCENDDGEIVLCRVERDFTRNRPIAVNLDEERAILQQLIDKRATLEAAAQRAIRSCRAAYPEG